MIQRTRRSGTTAGSASPIFLIAVAGSLLALVAAAVAAAAAAAAPAGDTGNAAATAADSSAAAGRPKITRQDDLPRHTYAISMPVVELVQSPEAIRPLARAVRANLDADLATYDIEDRSTLKGMYEALMTLDVIDGDYDAALAHLRTVRGLEEKPALRLTAGIALEARAAAFHDAGGTGDLDAYRQAFRRHYDSAVRALPWDVVQDVLQQTKGQLEMLSEPLLLGLVQERVQPVVTRAGKVSQGLAQQLLGIHSLLENGLLVKEQAVAVLQQVIDEHHEQKPDIWAARDVDLGGRAGLTPVLVAVWDTGVDTAIYDGALFVNPEEQLDGKDDDGNGFADDLHGIAFDLHWLPATGSLYPMDACTHPVAELASYAKGFFDLQASLDTPDAQTLKQRMASLTKDDVKPFFEDLTRYTLYAHGTHVAGIVVAGNPAARVLYTRLTGDPRMISEPPTMEYAHNAARAFRQVADYYRRHGVRVVNMSWVIARSSLEHDLEANGIGQDAGERKRMARAMFEVIKDGLRQAFESAPAILFVGGAGNSDNDITFDEFVPPMFELPNLLIAGAVDQAGEATDFTSFGPTVNVYANGFEVESYVPGGDRVKFSGTSMASPNAANLAAKLIAIDPALSPPGVITLIRAGADTTRQGEQLLHIINPQRSVELLEQRLQQAR